MSDQLPPRLPPLDPSLAGVPASVLSAELLAGLLADGDDELAAWTLRHALEEQSRVEVYDGILRDAMVLVGQRWESGRWTVSEEHLASRTLLRALEQVRPPMRPEQRVGPLAVLAGAAGEQHMIGLVCLEHLLAEAGWSVANLGADLPSPDLGQFVLHNDVALVALTANGSGRTTAVADAIGAVRAAAGDRRLPVMLGGGIAATAGIEGEVGADEVVSSLAAALAYATAHRPA